ncbi:ParB N-terminal domain-containing protein [Amycolatopsis vastitatis]|uniref:ParB-like N-terminal domain-containing protein n=1 Tax=Amycolatopsis vastitatis TaxID=1905142 RepID=A0A229SLB6_9PSEU|nr:ParB N-terminal domain-containing protein [Amycolatopsis vastitatis]OXM59534.1 hypothetical protein CF165_47190 [Amycolatopsis vastitatis]
MGNAMLGEIATLPRTSPDGNVHTLPAQPVHARRRSIEAVVVSHQVLLPADSPRIGGEDSEHVRALAEQSGPLPPILVHRPTMRVIDGMHRLRASTLRGETDIAVQFFDGTPEEAFILAVRANARHGLPLSQVDRAAAASRILASHPDLSDSAIASIAGISDKTVAATRRSTSELPKSNRRRGRDGRSRPVDPAEGRQKAQAYLSRYPTATIREIATAAGIALSTAQDVRKRVQAGQDPLPPTLRTSVDQTAPDSRPEPSAPTPPQTASDPHTVTIGQRQPLEALKADPSLCLSDTGRTVIRILDILDDVDEDFCEQLADNLPQHCLPSVLEVARQCAEAWTNLIKGLEDRSATQP